jgi:hypothetical protein
MTGLSSRLSAYSLDEEGQGQLEPPDEDAGEEAEEKQGD